METENITEMGFSISHQHDGGKLVKSIKNITVKCWVGHSDSVNLVYLPDVTTEYSDIEIRGKVYENTKIVSRESMFEERQLYYVYELEQRIDDLECVVLGDLKISEIESFSHNISTSRNQESVSFTRSFSVQLVDTTNYVSTPKSVTGLDLIDKAVSEINKALQVVPEGWISIDDEINDVVNNSAQPCTNDEEGRYTKNRSEQIDHVRCSVQISETTSKRISPDDCCIESQTVSLRWDENGLVNIGLNGSIKGGCQKFSGCGEERRITKTRYDFAFECYSEEAIRERILEEYEKHQLDKCETDVCLALRINSRSISHGYQSGTINYSFSAQEEEVLDRNNDAFVYLNDDEKRDGCIISLTRNFDISAPVNNSFVEKNPDYLSGDCSDTDVTNTAEEAIEKSRNALARIVEEGKLDPPEGFFGPLSFSMNECPSKGTIVGVMNYSNDLKYDIPISDSLVKKKIKKSTTCITEVKDNRFHSPCACPVIQKQVVQPGYTALDLQVEAFPCASLSDLKSEIQLDLDPSVILVASNTSYSVQDGGLSASTSVKYHTEDDLNECK